MIPWFNNGKTLVFSPRQRFGFESHREYHLGSRSITQVVEAIGGVRLSKHDGSIPDCIGSILFLCFPTLSHSFVAQLVEHPAVNRTAVSSNLAGGAIVLCRF